MHLDDDRLQRLIDGELTGADAAAARAHLESCAACRAREAEAVRDAARIATLLEAVDEPAPALEPEAITAAAAPMATAARDGADGRRVRTAPDERAHARGGGRRPPREPRLAWAAALAVAVIVAGGAYAWPGSPVRAWIGAALARLTAPDPPQPPVRSDAPAAAGIAVAPGAALVIEIATASDDAEARIALTDGSDVVARAPAGLATFTTLDGRLEIAGPPAAAYAIEVPRAAPRVEVRVAGRTVWIKDGARIESATAPDGTGSYTVPLGAP